MTWSKAADVFSAIPQGGDRLRTLVDVGLATIKLGQPAPPSPRRRGSSGSSFGHELSKQGTGKDALPPDRDPPPPQLLRRFHKLMDVMQRLVDRQFDRVVIELKPRM